MALISRDPEQATGPNGFALNVLLPFVGPLYVSTCAVERAATGFPFVAVAAGAVSFTLAAAGLSWAALAVTAALLSATSTLAVLMLCDVLARIY